MKIGLKLYSSDISLIPETEKLKDSILDFVELYIVPGSYRNTIVAWRNLDVSFVIHAPHSFHGVNLAQAEKWETNSRCLHESRLFAEDLLSDIIIVHGGNNGSFQETLHQLHLIRDSRLILENKPIRGLFDEECVGWSPAELHLAVETGAVSGTALDLVHAWCAALSLQREAMGLIREFLELKPRVFHLSDADAQSEKDSHFNFGKGSLDIRRLLSVVPNDGWLTIEAPRDSSRGLTDFITDVHYLRKLISENSRKQEMREE